MDSAVAAPAGIATLAHLLATLAAVVGLGTVLACLLPPALMRPRGLRALVTTFATAPPSR